MEELRNSSCSESKSDQNNMKRQLNQEKTRSKNSYVIANIEKVWMNKFPLF